MPFSGFFPVTAVLSLKIEKGCLISRQRLLKRVNYDIFVICCADLFRQIIFRGCIPTFLNQELQHPFAYHKGDAELTTASFNMQLPNVGALPWKGGGRYLLWAVHCMGRAVVPLCRGLAACTVKSILHC